MGRPSQSRALGVWANGTYVGRWTIPKNAPMELSYDEGWASSPEGRPLSLSLPFTLDELTVKGERVGNYFDNLLPDSEPIRRRIASRYGVAGRDPFQLLGAIGRDCVGAVQLLPVGEQPQDVFQIRAKPLDDTRVEQLLRAVTRTDFPAADSAEDLRISLAGAQEKTALTLHRRRWCVPLGSTPTTHILKLPLGLVGNDLDLSTSIENEWLCSRLLAAFGLPVAHCELAQFGEVKTLVVRRFDRRLHPSKKYWLRLPQEDFCQATGKPGSTKYEADGGPGLVEISQILSSSDSRDADLATLLKAQLLFWMLAATDGHAKNFSIHLMPQGHFRLTPLYDVISVWPVVGKKANQLHEKKVKLAMALRGKKKHYRIVDMRRDHFNATARACGLGSDMNGIIDAAVEATPVAVERVGNDLPQGFPPHVFDAITTGLKRASHSLAATARSGS
jgi:serine/threonine-protein kinase HipA